MSRLIPMLAVLLLALTPAATRSAAVQACEVSDAQIVDQYPDLTMSPEESLAQHDAVFLAEVAVPAKRCSLGYCAGLKVLRPIKGDLATTVLVRVSEAKDSACAPRLFGQKGGRWLVFANGGTSKSGHKYAQVSDDGPSYAASALPDFRDLENRYRAMRARLDSAISERLR